MEWRLDWNRKPFYPRQFQLHVVLLGWVLIWAQFLSCVFCGEKLALLSATLRTYQKAACDSDQVTIACPRGTSISIEFAQYNKFVAKDGYSIEDLCHVTGEARPEIQGRSQHLLRGSIFGLPSLNGKYMKDVYGHAESLESVSEPTSSSTTGFVDEELNIDYNSENAPENCMWPNALQYSLLQTVVDACQKKKHCKFHGSLQFYGQGASGVGDSSGTSSYHSSTASTSAMNSDPCYKRRKLVEIAYKCRPYEFRSKVACHNDVAQLECNPYSRIAIYSASFGRTEYESIQCPQPQGVPEETCLVSYATETVMKICHGRRRCYLAADANTFGSPCQPNSRMYLKVVYTCVPMQVLKESKESEVEPDEAEEFKVNMNELYDDEPIYKESEAIPKLYSNTTITGRRNSTSTLWSVTSISPVTNQTNSFGGNGDGRGMKPVMTHSADLSIEEHQERLYIYLLVLCSLGVFFSILIIATRLVLQKRRGLTTDTHTTSEIKGCAIDGTTIQNGLDDTVSQIDVDIDLKTPMPLPSVSKNKNCLTYVPASSVYASLSLNHLSSVSGQDLLANQLLVETRQSPDLIGRAAGSFGATGVANSGGQGILAGILPSAVVIGTSASSSSAVGTMIPNTTIAQYTTAPTIRGEYLINAEGMGAFQRPNNTQTPPTLLAMSSLAEPTMLGSLAMNVPSQNHVPASAEGTSALHPSYDGTAPRTLSTGVAIGSQFYYG
ncbi:uncharacterized protein LOC108111611 [Drosophila eugracilis]|uniref:uncharacterized protein LOC108111611 n=1 Tax=Drosophila eugracilis TaxID=29029 RepID=UPI001BDAD891|nr:uncharacterized protein LOC108111611 [Drosophila eugracilis]XP_041675280.1 uncharacterized protein LOC108111611 [Drosophila eugracilis]XP_041675281.1 uncharacterized protein LOC108111611 [Drosophila eugracilis]XP_041675282.1 uncharacterized protein LOC108111611 [Drosophila eugracilis]